MGNILNTRYIPRMGNSLGIILVVNAATIIISNQLEYKVPRFGYYIIYTVCFILSTIFGANGPKVGKEAPPLAPGDLKYLQKKGDEARPGTKGKVVVIERWATWCGPCVRMVPHLNEIYKANKKNPNFQLVGVTNETDENLIKSFIEKHKMEYSVAIDAKGAVEKGYPCSGIPNATIVGKDGKVFWSGHPAQMDDPLKAALSASSKPSGVDVTTRSAAGAKDAKDKKYE